MSLCFVSPRFYPIIGGVEKYLQNIAEYCSSHIKTIIITSNLKNTPKNVFEKYSFVKKRYDILKNNIEIIRTHTTNNRILKTIFYLNQYLNKKMELFIDKKINPNLYLKNNRRRINDNVSKYLMKGFIFQRSYANPNFLELYYTLKKIHNTNEIKIIHSSPLYLSTNIYAYRFSRKKKIPFICTPLFHINPYADYIFYPSYQQIFKNSEAIIACTNIEKEYYQKYGVDKEKIHIIPPGIEPNDYKKQNIEIFKKKHHILEKDQILLYMGRKTYEKGAINAILALKHLIKNNKNVKLLMAGPESREYNSFLKKLPSSLKKYIIDLGLVDNKSKSSAFACCDIFLLPSLDDAFGIVYLEAWLFKKPVIGALEGNVADLIDDNLNGFLVPFNNIESFASKIDLLLKDKNLRDKFGQNGYNKLNNNYTLDITNKKMLNLYKKFI